MVNSRKFYAAQDVWTEPGEYASLLQSLPADRVALHTAINGVLLHVWKVRKYHPEWLSERPHDTFTRRIASVLRRVHSLGDTPLSESRPEEERVIVDCRTFALLQCAVMCSQGIPARVRCGFASYLEETRYQDHWVCEWWDNTANRWVMDDPDIGKTDIASDEFYTGAQAWLLCRSDSSHGKKFGWGPTATGMWAARVNLVCDFAALNGFPSVSGDSWGLAYRKSANVTSEDNALLDKAALLTLTDDQFSERLKLYEERDEFHVPETIHHFDYVAGNHARNVDWRTDG